MYVYVGVLLSMYFTRLVQNPVPGKHRFVKVFVYIHMICTKFISFRGYGVYNIVKTDVAIIDHFFTCEVYSLVSCYIAKSPVYVGWIHILKAK